MTTCRAFLLTVAVACSFKQGYFEFIQSPRDTEALIGQPTYLNCSSHDEVEWRFISNASSKYFQVLRLPIDDGRIYVDSSQPSHHDLVFSKVTVQDAGRYICADLTHGDTAGAEVIILETPPICGSNVTTEGVIGPNSCGLRQEPVKLSCGVSYRGNKPPSLHWAETAVETVANTTSHSCDSRDVTSCSMSLTKTVTSVSHMNALSLECRSKRSATTQYSCTATLNVIYAVGDNVTHEQTVDDTIVCSTNTSSDRCSYKWKWTDADNVRSELSNRAVTAKTPGMYLCEANCELKGRSCQFVAMTAHVSDRSFFFSPIFYAICAIALALLLVTVVITVAVCKRRRKHRTYQSARPYIKEAHADTYETIAELSKPGSRDSFGSDCSSTALGQDTLQRVDYAQDPVVFGVNENFPLSTATLTLQTRMDTAFPMANFPNTGTISSANQIYSPKTGAMRESDGIYLTFVDESGKSTVNIDERPPLHSPKAAGVVSKAAPPADVDRTANMVKGSRKQISWCYFDQNVTAGVDEQIGDALEILSYKPSTALVFCSSLLLEDNVSVSCRNKPEGIPFVEYLESKLPPPCTITGISGFGVIGTDFYDQSISEMERSLAASCLFFPKIDGFEIIPFGFDIEPRDVATHDEPANTLVEQVTGIPRGKTVKFMMMFLDTDPQTPHDKDLIGKILGHYGEAVMAGGYTYGSIYNRTKSRAFGPCRSLPGLGIAFCGKDIQVASIILQTDVEKEKDIEARLLRLKSTNITEWPSLAFMFSCMCRGTTKYRGRKNVESEIFRRIFPRTPLVGFFGRGEIGYDHLPFYTEGKANRAKNAGRRISGDIYHTFTTIFVMISFPQMNYD